MLHALAQRYVLFVGQDGAEAVAETLAKGPSVRVLGVLSNSAPMGSILSGLPVLGSYEDWTRLPDDILFNAPLYTDQDMLEYAEAIDTLHIPAHRWGSAIHPLSSISSAAQLGQGSVVGPFCDIHPGVVMGRHVALRTGAFVGHGTRIEDYVRVGPNTVISGSCSVEEGVQIGPNVTILDNVRVGSYAVIGANSVVSKDVEDFETVAPASVVNGE